MADWIQFQRIDSLIYWNNQGFILYKIPNNGILFSHLFWGHLNPTFSILLPDWCEATESGLPMLPASWGQPVSTDS